MTRMLSAWFLRPSAPVIAAPLTQQFNQSIRCAVVPQQWKMACISPISKVAHPAEASDYNYSSAVAHAGETLC